MALRSYRKHRVGPALYENVESVLLNSRRRVYIVSIGGRLHLGLGDRMSLECGFNHGRIAGRRWLAVAAEWWPR